MAFPARAMFLHSVEGSLHVGTVQYCDSKTWKYFFFFNNRGLFLHPSLNQPFSSHVSSLHDSSEISVPLSAMISNAFPLSSFHRIV